MISALEARNTTYLGGSGFNASYVSAQIKRAAERGETSIKLDWKITLEFNRILISKGYSVTITSTQTVIGWANKA